MPNDELKQLQDELAQVQAARTALRTVRDVPFVWEIAFVEIFEGDNKGFDIVIGNPPYVRQEEVRNHMLGEAGKTSAEKKRYKDQIVRSIYTRHPRYFGYNAAKGKTTRKLSNKSDLYIYFFFHGLKLLNEHGSFCFVTSNSWLDVGYGADLQEFLLRQSHVRFLIDNKSRRTFANAAVNSTIALLGPVDERKDVGLSNTTRFVMFEVPFEDALRPNVWQQIEAATARTKIENNATEDRVYVVSRVFPMSQAALLQDGMPATDTPADDGEAAPKAGEYAGNKWGGKYLRAPDIYYTLLERGKGKLVRLGDIADVRFGIKTGANEFFYLDDDKITQWGIEAEFLKPVIKGPRECRSIVVHAADIKTSVLMCSKIKFELEGTKALRYIEWGEKQGFHKNSTCSARGRWWDLGKREYPNIVWVKSINDVHRQSLIPFEALVDQRLYEITHRAPFNLNLALNATITILMKELEGRVNLGEGVLDTAVYEAQNIPVLNPDLLPDEEARPIYAVMSQRTMLPVKREIEQPDRRALDNIVFDVLKLTQGEQDAVYEAVIDLVEARLKKAASFKITKANAEDGKE